MVCGAKATHLYPLHILCYHISWHRSPAESGHLLENLRTHTYNLRYVTCCMIRTGIGNGLLQFSDMFDTRLTNRWKLLNVFYELPILSTSMISFGSSSVWFFWNLQFTTELVPKNVSWPVDHCLYIWIHSLAGTTLIPNPDHLNFQIIMQEFVQYTFLNILCLERKITVTMTVQHTPT